MSGVRSKKFMKMFGVVLIAGVISSQVAQPAFASTTTADESEAVSFSVFGDLGLSDGDSVTLEQLESVGVTESQLENIGLDVSVSDGDVVPPSNSLSADMAPMAASSVVSWTSRDNKTVYLRDAPRQKIETKHNLTTNVVKIVTMHANDILNEPNSSTGKNYYLTVYDIRCIPLRCWAASSTSVRVLVDYRAYGSQTYGVVTAYCEGIEGKCPDFVKNALNQ